MFKFCYWLVYICLWPIYRFRFVNKEKIVPGGALICGNHTANIDSGLVILALGDKLQYGVISKKELFDIPLLGWLLSRFGAYPVSRGANDLQAIKYSLKILREGKKLIIFPEGTRVKGNKVSEPKTGSAMLAVKSGTPIIPVYITPGRKAFRGCTLTFGDAFYPQIAGEKPESKDYERITNEIMDKIWALGKEAVK